jgi:hypothetical protein
MPAWLTWLIAMGILLAESAFLAAFGVEGWSLQTAVLLTIFLALRRDFVSGSMTLAALLIPIQWLAAGPSGYYALSLVVVFFALQLARGSIQSDWGLSQAFLAMVAVLVQTGTMLVALLILEPDAHISQALILGAVPGCVSAALIAWPLGALLTRLDRLVAPRSGRKMTGFS